MPAGRFAPTNPLAIKTKTQSKVVKVPDGHDVHFQPGKGYFTASPAETAQQEVAGQTAPILAGLDADNAAYGAERKATSGFNLAAGKLIGGIGPSVGAGYDAAAAEVGDLAKGFSSNAQDKFTSEQDAGNKFVSSQGQTVPTGVDPQAFGDAMYAENGFIPGSLLAAQGAHARQWAGGMVAANTAQGRQDLTAVDAAQAKNTASVAAKLAATAAKFPALFTAAQHAEIKANLDQAKFAEKSAHDAGSLAERTVHDSQSLALTEAYHEATIKVRGQSNQIALMRAQQAGHKIDKGSSMVTGFVTFADGTLLTSKGGSPVPVDQRVYTAASKTASTKQLTDAVKGSFKEASLLLGAPSVNKNVTSFAPGAYFAKPTAKINGSTIFGAPGMRPTTNDPKLAQRAAGASTFVEAQQMIYGALGGDAIIAQGLITESKLMKVIRAQMIRAGWKPDGKRPTPKTNPYMPDGSSVFDPGVFSTPNYLAG